MKIGNNSGVILRDLYFENLKTEAPSRLLPFLKLYLIIFGIPLPFKRLRSKQIIKYLKKTGANTCLDLGCGVGDIGLRGLLETRYRLTGFDIDSQKIATARKIVRKYKLNAVFKVADLEKSTPVRGRFDALICSNIAAHLNNDQYFFKQLAGLAKRGGYLIFCEDLDSRRPFSAKKERQLGHFRNGYNFNKLTKNLQRLGFSILDYQFIDTFDIANKYYYCYPKIVQLLIFPLFMPLVFLLDRYGGPRPNMVVLLAKLH